MNITDRLQRLPNKDIMKIASRLQGLRNTEIIDTKEHKDYRDYREQR